MVEISACRAWRQLPGYLLGSWALTWLVPETVLGVAIIFLYFAWLLTFPMWRLMWMS
jgi:hypothetical protein